MSTTHHDQKVALGSLRNLEYQGVLSLHSFLVSQPAPFLFYSFRLPLPPLPHTQTMISLLLAAVIFLIASVAFYVILRRQRYGGLAGGSGTASPPRTRALHGSARTYSLAEVETHNTEHDLWLIIRGKVYDFTDYFSLHPGGEAILRNAGRDSTMGFSGSQHPPRVWDMVRQMFHFFCQLLI